jgi:hypothetical protein
LTNACSPVANATSPQGAVIARSDVPKLYCAGALVKRKIYRSLPPIYPAEGYYADYSLPIYPLGANPVGVLDNLIEFARLQPLNAQIANPEMVILRGFYKTSTRLALGGD